MYEGERLKIMVNAWNRDAAEVIFLLEEKDVFEWDVFIPTLDPVLRVDVIPDIHFAKMTRIYLKVCQYFKHDMNTWPIDTVGVVTMCLSLEAKQKGYPFMVYPLIQDIKPEQMLQVDDKNTKVLCISYIKAHYGFLITDK